MKLVIGSIRTTRGSLMSSALVFGLLGGGCSSSSSTGDDAGNAPAPGTEASTHDDAASSADDASSGEDASPPDAGSPLPDAAGAPSGFTFKPSNVPLTVFPAAGDVTITATGCIVDTDKLTVGCVQAGPDGGLPYVFTSAMQSDGSQVALLSVHSIAVQQSGTVTIQGSVPLIVWAQTTANIQGSLSTATDSGRGSAGGSQDTQSGTGGGPGGGGPSTDSSYVGASGAGYCGTGGNGANSAGDAGVPTPGGRSYGTSSLTPLIGGSAGGGPGGGEGGGALQITAGVSILIGTGGVINVPGLGASGNGAAGGSGGSLLLEAPTVTIDGVLAANGGGGDEFNGGGTAQPGQTSASPAQGTDPKGGTGGAGTSVNGGDGKSTSANETGGGGGAVGRIRINTTSGSATLGSSSLISPATTTPCVTQGAL